MIEGSGGIFSLVEPRSLSFVMMQPPLSDAHNPTCTCIEMRGGSPSGNTQEGGWVAENDRKMDEQRARTAGEINNQTETNMKGVAHTAEL